MDPVWPFVFVPLGHASQLLESVVVLNVFSAHKSQLLPLSALINDPVGHA